jgi:hypothetical protein
LKFLNLATRTHPLFIFFLLSACTNRRLFFERMRDPNVVGGGPPTIALDRLGITLAEKKNLLIKKLKY